MNARSVVLGIDLGTSFSSACVFLGGRAHLILDGRGEACIPSVVHFPQKGPPIVGADAERMRWLDPTNTVTGIKRLLGCTSMSSPSARVVDASVPYKLVDRGDGSPLVSVRGGMYRPQQIAGFIVRYLKERAEARFGGGIYKAVLTHPVSASPDAVEATIGAARLAGLQVVGTLSEPCAGAVAVGLAHQPADRRLLMFDFGGGTLDITAMVQEGTRFHVLSAGGDDLLGGDDFDRALAGKIANAAWCSRGVDVRRDVILWARLTHQCEQAKRALSNAPQTRVRLEELGGDELDLALTRGDVEPCWDSLSRRSVELAAETMVSAGLRPKDLTAIVPIGGTTYIPLVRRTLERVIPVPCVEAQDRQTAVAIGAAMFGAGAVELAS